ncbi:FdhF/YdeP family oxidoreductase [Rhodobacteraceae bacterium RKSG542]|uniref:FdhF/YdeP family oxidoreductase n=1 Tax=Pseudovibrio flavus TaxID=2529854 RepID=UPI0012BC9B05|nr:FdhF/YdeP family oxidoreductase [Pseudovibrio flavus]MTI18623.1 FdhF/YdeP family oxidoreductase [Pseudovibrio flavus]
MQSRDQLKTYKGAAGGWGALKSCAQVLWRTTNPVTGAYTVSKSNQPDGFDCPGCAWGDPEHGSSFEFCENGVKAVAWEATDKRVTPAFFAKHSVRDLLRFSDMELESAGRLTQPMRYNPVSGHYEAVSWAKAFEDIGKHLKALDSPDEALFYTSGRTSNEAAYLYQLFGRVFGTNNFPDCSNMCHEASGVALGASIGIGKGTVRLEDFEKAEAIFVFGQNPGTNHPRMLTSLREAHERGARIVAVNPLKERGLERFSDPKNKLEMLTGGSRPIATSYFTPKLGGDMAMLRGMAKAIFAWDAERILQNGTIDRAFIAEHTNGFEDYEAAVEQTTWSHIEEQSGLTKQQIEDAALIYVQSSATIFTWAMGITQHAHSVVTIRELANLLLLRGNIGKEGAGACPVRGHSNVQGDRTVGINEQPPSWFLDNLEKLYPFKAPRSHGLNTVQAIEAMRDGTAKVFIGMGGNFARATPDTAVVEKALRNCALTVNIATKLNRGHLITGKASYILPCLGRTEFDEQASGRQLVSVEDSMSMVHGSAGINPPASEHLLSEPAIVAGIAKATVGSELVDWDSLIANYDDIRVLIEKTVPGFAGYNERVRVPRGFYLGNSAAQRKWKTHSGRAEFCAAALPAQTVYQRTLASKEPTFTLQTIRSHDQYNTTVYAMNDRYRGVKGLRHVVFMCEADMERLGLVKGDLVDMRTVSEDGQERVARRFVIAPFEIPVGCVASYYPETNVLVPLYARGEGSYTPTSKSIPVTITRSEPAQTA